MVSSTENPEQTPHKPLRTFGTFEGVFTPTILAILGVIMYLRLGWVVGNAGILGALFIILIAVFITASTGLSLASIATNTRMEAGGPFGIIYRALGREVAGSIGVPLVISQSLVVAMYVFGFREGWNWIFPDHPAFLIDLAAFLVVCMISWVSAGLAFRIQYVILTIIVLSVFSVLFCPKTLLAPQGHYYLWGDFPGTSFWQVFAVFFPATTGIMVGANMSGELTNPRKSVPQGTLYAIAISSVVYLLLAMWCAYTSSPSELLNNFTIMVDKSLWQPIVVLGILGATFSSALSSHVGAPRILQAMGRKKLLPFGNWFGKSASNGEPRNAMIATSLIALLGLLMRDLNAIAALVTMFFLITYCTLNIIVLLESSIGLLSFRPTLRINRMIPLVGAIGCIFAMFIINPTFSLVATGLVVLLYIWLVLTSVGGEDNDIRSSFFEAIAAWVFVRFTVFDRENPRTWKPNILVPVEEPEEFESEHQFLLDLGRPEGSLKLIGLAKEGIQAEILSPKISGLGQSFRSEKLFTTWSTINCKDYFNGVVIGLQALQSALFRPNILLLRVPDIIERQNECLEVIYEARRARVGVLLLKKLRDVGFGKRQVINLWVRPDNPQNLHLSLNRGAMHLAILFTIQITRAWGARINLISSVASESQEENAKLFLEQIIEHCRLPEPVSSVVLVGTLDECIEKAPHSDLEVLGLQTKPDFSFIERMANTSKSSSVFVLDSGRENALA